MLEKIESKFFVNQRIFSLIEERLKLKFMKYNKRLQKNMNISILNFKHFSERYIIYESNGIGKEYAGETDTLIFKGEYLNGERNEIGKEYDDDNGKSFFEGEYLNGERNGKGKEFYDNVVIFDGIYLNGERNGEGKEFYDNGKLKFDGEYLNDLKWKGNYMMKKEI